MASGLGPIANLSGVVDANNYLKVNVAAGSSGGLSPVVDDADFTAGSSEGAPAMGVYQSVVSAVTDGDFGIVGITANRELKVDITSNTAGVGGGTQYTDDTDVHATGTTKITMLGAAATPTDSAVDANDVGALAMSTDRRLHTDTQLVGTDTAIDIQTETQLDYDTDGPANNLSVIGIALPSASGPVAGGTTTNPIQIQSNSANVATETTVAAVQTAVEIIDDWDESDRAKVNLIVGQAGIAAGTGVDGATVPRVTLATNVALPAGTNAIGKLAANSGVDIGDVDVLSLPASTNTLEVVGDVSHGTAVSGNPVLVGARAIASVEGQTEQTAGDNSYINATLSGNLITQAQVAPEELVSFYVANTDGLEDAVTGLDAGGATIHNYVTSVTIANSHASTNAVVSFLAGSGGGAWWAFPAPAGGGVTMNFHPPLKQPTANQALYVDPSAAVSTIYISIQGYQGQG